jgi:hypothetical protein
MSRSSASSHIAFIPANFTHPPGAAGVLEITGWNRQSLTSDVCAEPL